jgi:MFS family permease
VKVPHGGRENFSDRCRAYAKFHFMRTLLYILLGTAAGLALGILLPFVGAITADWRHPGDGAAFLLLLIFTAPLGAICGAAWGFQRAHTRERVVKEETRRLLARFAVEYRDWPFEAKRDALLQLLPDCLHDYRMSMMTRMTVTVALLAFGSVWIKNVPIGLLFPLIYLLQTRKIIRQTRAGLQLVTDQCGNDVIAQSGPLPLTLRPVPPALAGIGHLLGID